MWIKDLDEKDNKIINILLKDGRASYSEIGNGIGLSRTAVKDRIAALEKKGIIEGYRAIVNPQRPRGMMTFILNIETEAESFEDTKKMLSEIPTILTIIQTTGYCHLLAVCVASDEKEMQYYVRKFYNQQGVTSINFHAVIDVIKGSIIPR